MSGPRFGRRSSVTPGPAKAPLPALSKFARGGGASNRDPGRIPAGEHPPVDEELKAWKKTRGFSSYAYVRPVALMASLSFGVASVALPAAVNAWMEYPLYALSAASLYIGFRRKHG